MATWCVSATRFSNFVALPNKNAPNGAFFSISASMSSYHFILNPRYKELGGKTHLVSVLDANNMPLENGMALFSMVSIKDIPFFLRNALDKISRSYANYAGLAFGFCPAEEYDGLPEIPDNFVELADFTGTSLIPITDFYALCLAFAHKSIEAYHYHDLQKSGAVDARWLEEIEEIIPELEKLSKYR